MYRHMHRHVYTCVYTIINTNAKTCFRTPTFDGVGQALRMDMPAPHGHARSARTCLLCMLGANMPAPHGDVWR